MRVVASCLLVCAISCAERSNPPLAAPSSLEVDLEREIVEVPGAICPAFGGWLAVSENAARRMIINQRKQDNEHAVALVSCEGTAKLAEARQRKAEAQLEQSGWWSRYGLLLGVSSFFVGVALGGVFGAAYGKAIK